MKKRNQVLILVADDDLDDCEMIREALHESRILNTVYFVHDGEQLMDYLNHKGKFVTAEEFPFPGLILLDLNMPKKGGREVLQEIKGDPRLRHIPIIVFTTSKAEEDIFRSYNLGVNSFVTKPVAFGALVQLMKDFGRYWFEIVELPDPPDKGSS